MRCCTPLPLLILSGCLPCVAQANSAPLPSAPDAHAQVLFSASPSGPPLGKPTADSAPLAQTSLLPAEAATKSITRSESDTQALKNNPRITASRLLSLAAGQVTRETRSAELPQIGGAATAEKAEDGSRIGASPGSLTSSHLYTHASFGGNFSQLITDFGHTSNLVATSRLQQKAQDQTTLATQQDVLLATDQAFYRLLNAQSLLQVAKATVDARASVQQLTQALTQSALKSDLDLNVAAADLSQSQLLQLDAENAVASARAALAALLVAPADTRYQAVEDANAALPPPPDLASTQTMNKDAQAQRPDLQSLKLNAQAYGKLAHAQELQRLPSISALAIGGLTPIGVDGVFEPHRFAAAAVNVTVPIFTGFRITAQTEEAYLRQQATEKQAQSLSDTIARDMQTSVLDAQTAFRRIAVADQFRKQTAQALSLAQTRYKLGLSSIVELSQAQLQSTQATVSAVNARYDYLLALRALDYTRGQLTP